MGITNCHGHILFIKVFKVSNTLKGNRQQNISKHTRKQKLNTIISSKNNSIKYL